eukprot:TRINITY_DN12504_c0_g1_i4.p3 TRINITY_DN12504_c0_g1~~TRINITY_DN12504_c0_g1_i4.p3  ORF type:complete len:146 (+),score=43.20 TRINITY_DN12504_c0_g1_i4:58-495(+)
MNHCAPPSRHSIASDSARLYTHMHACIPRRRRRAQVAERALFFWNNEQLVGPGGALSMANAGALLPVLLGPVRRHADGHWNAVVEGLASNVLKMFMDHDPVLFDRCSQDLLREEAETARQRLEADQRWAALERQVQATRATRLRD